MGCYYANISIDRSIDREREKKKKKQMLLEAIKLTINLIDGQRGREKKKKKKNMNDFKKTTTLEQQE